MPRSRDDIGDEELLLAAQNDGRAFTVFYERHVGVILAFFFKRLSNRELAADLCHETFAAAMLAIADYDPELSPPLAWLFMLANRRLIDALRRGTVEDDARLRLGVDRMLLDDRELERVEEKIDAAQHGDALAILEQLSEEHREAVNGRILNGESYADLAERLQCSESVVRQRVHRGLSHLRRRMRQP